MRLLVLKRFRTSKTIKKIMIYSFSKRYPAGKTKLLSKMMLLKDWNINKTVVEYETAPD
jgi:hypothetical protein